MRRKPSQSCRVHVQLSICHSWTGNTNSSCFFVINLSLSLSQSRKHTWANKTGLHSVPEKQPSLLMLHTNTACLFYLCVNPSSVWRVSGDRQCPSCRSERGRQTDPALTFTEGGGYAVTTLTLYAACKCSVCHPQPVIHTTFTVIYCGHNPARFQGSGIEASLRSTSKKLPHSVVIRPSSAIRNTTEALSSALQGYSLMSGLLSTSLVYADQLIRSAVSNVHWSASVQILISEEQWLCWIRLLFTPLDRFI